MLKILERKKNVFISHGKFPEVYKKIVTFIKTLKLNPIVDEEEPNRGNGLDVKIERMMGKSNCAIIIATPDDFIATGQNTIPQPRGNVLHEIGIAQNLYEKKIIYLKEKNAVFPTNISPKVYYSFEIIDNDRVLLEDAYLGIIKDLIAFKILKI